VVPLLILIGVEAVRGVVTGYDGAAGGTHDWPAQPRGGDLGAGILVFHATVFSGLVALLAVWLAGRAWRARRSPVPT
jgi:hypothetical protein